MTSSGAFRRAAVECFTSDLQQGSGQPRGAANTAGASLLPTLVYYMTPPDLSTHVYLSMTPMVRTEDLIDAQGVADLLGLAQRNTVSAYQHRYPDMPRPVV